MTPPLCLFHFFAFLLFVVPPKSRLEHRRLKAKGRLGIVVLLLAQTKCLVLLCIVSCFILSCHVSLLCVVFASLAFPGSAQAKLTPGLGLGLILLDSTTFCEL